MDYSIDAVTPVHFAAIDRFRLQRISEALPSFMAGVLQQQAFRQALLREWLLNLGRRSAAEIRSDLERTNEAIHAAAPKAPITWFRQPGGRWRRGSG